MTFWEEVTRYQDTQAAHQDVVARFTQHVNDTPPLKAHRDFIEQHFLGFGDRSFQWMWKLLVDELPLNCKFLEIGVYCGQIVSLVKMLNLRAEVYGITPLSQESGPKGEFPKFPDVDYRERIQFLHDHFSLPMPELIVGKSTDPQILQQAHALAPFDVVYIDGGHEYEVVCQDLQNYPPLVKDGGFLVVDDCANFLNMYNGSFPGILQVSRAVRDILEPQPQWTHLFACMHNRIWQKTS